MNNSKILILLFCLFLIPNLTITFAAEPTPQQAIDAEKAGDHKKALEIFTKLAEKGDAKAMIDIGVKYYIGEGVAQDYKKSMDWWLRAFEARNGDAIGNIGVLYRDGKGVKQNRKIAYLLFLLTHMEGLGTESTQIRVNAHLRREMAEQQPQELQEALCYTIDYVLAYIRAKGELKTIPKEVLPSAGKIRIKDNNWWLERERKNMNFDCKPPWN